ncbi:MAG TPA: FkbM family methyltransferase [Candidatus Binataceae bacterium]|nr:FkbM family methyltransferase [Candidatus Binataceae bacterium]
MPLRLLPHGKIMTIRRGPAAGLKWTVGSADHGCWLGTYELAKQRSLEQFVKRGMTIYDVGAQAGFYTLFFSCLVGSGGAVYSFEPCAYEARNLLEHVRINHLQNVRVIQAALWKTSGLSPLTIDQGQTQNKIPSGNGADSILQVPTFALDELKLPPPQLIKMDVEGAESAVLQGALRTLQEHRPIMFVALHDDEQRRACAELLHRSNYTLYALDGTRLSHHIELDEIYALP